MNGGSDDPNSLRNQVFSRLFDENWAAVRHHIECVVDDESEVTEMVSEVFLTAWAKLSTRRPMGRAWLLRVADRRLHDRLGRTADRAAVTDAVHAGIFGEVVESSPGHEDILRALSGLRVRERRIIMLTYWDGLTAGEITESMGVSRPCAERILRSAHQKLRRSLGMEGRV